MERLTLKDLENTDTVIVASARTFGKQFITRTLTELKEYKQIEEELGIDLITLFKALKDGIYIIDMPSQDKLKHFKVRLSYVNNTWFFTSIKNDMCVDVKSYNKNWALTKEELN